MPEEKACDVCVNLRTRMRQAIEECNRSAEADVRVVRRRHMRETHGVELPPPAPYGEADYSARRATGSVGKPYGLTGM